MKSYKYPDNNDTLTCQMIDSEYDGKFWGESEQEVLSLAKQEAAKYRIMNYLDLGCGQGRLLEYFSDLAEHITGAEPDRERFEEAEKVAARLVREKDLDIRVVNGTAEDIERRRFFEMILSSHVLQHITVSMANDLMHTMSEMLVPNGLLVLTTTYAEGEDEFFVEELVEGKRFSARTNRSGFEQVFKEGERLPVRMIGENAFLELAQRHDFRVIAVLPYHYKDHKTIEEDRNARAAGIRHGARDVMYLLRKKDLTIDANINYHFSFSLAERKPALWTDREKKLREAIHSHFLTTVFMDSPEAEEIGVFKDLTVCQDFLYGGGLPFSCFRVLLKDFQLKFQNYEVTDSDVLMSVFAESNIVQLSIGVSFRNVEPDDYIYLRHCQGNGAKFLNIDGRELSIQDVFQEVVQCLGSEISDVEESYLIEVKCFGGEESIEEIMGSYPNLLYGMITGDEGWRNVPAEMAKDRLSVTWGSRNFIRYISFGSNALFLNLFDSREAEEYRKSRKEFDHRFYGDMNPYFLLDSSLAGINHGILFSMEMVLVIKTLCNRILRRQSEFHQRDDINIMKDIRKTKQYRSELLETLNKVENLSITEIGELEAVMVSNYKLESIIDKIKYLLELLESELDLLYSTNTNRMVNILTFAGLLLTVLGLIIDVI